MNCKYCEAREYFARIFGIHFDYKDCPYRTRCKKGGAE